MRADLIFRFDATFDYYIPVISGETVTWTLNRTGEAFLIPGSGDSVALLTKESLGVGDQVRNVRDRDGNEVFVTNGTSYPMYVTAASPQMSPFGAIIGWKHTLRRDLPRDMSATFDALNARIAAG